MCIAILQRSDSDRDIDYQTFERCERRNSHGMGIMWVENGEIKVWKSLDSLDLMYQKYREIRDKGIPVALHFRNATKGEVSLDNCHPFYVDEDMAMMHNGTLNIEVPEDGTSDTIEFRDKVLRNMPDNWVRDGEFRKMVNKYTGWSRFIFALSNGSFYLLNGDEGFWRSGVWYSNNDFMKHKHRGGKYYGRGYDWDDEDEDDSSSSETNSEESEDENYNVAGSDLSNPRVNGFLYQGTPICGDCIPRVIREQDDCENIEKHYRLFNDDLKMCSQCGIFIYPKKYLKKRGA